MTKKNILFLIILSLTIISCSNTKIYETGKLDNPYQIMEAKREQYRKQDEEKRKKEKQQAEEEEALKKIEEKKEANDITENIEEDIKNLSYEEKIQHKVNKAMEKVTKMVEVANKAREEEITDKATVDEIDSLLNSKNFGENTVEEK